jgi:predicted NAD/FAD-binding protein
VIHRLLAGIENILLRAREVHLISRLMNYREICIRGESRRVSDILISVKTDSTLACLSFDSQVQ